MVVKLVKQIFFVPYNKGRHVYLCIYTGITMSIWLCPGFVRTESSEPLNLLQQICWGGASSWAGMPCKEFDLLSSRSRSLLWGFMKSKYFLSCELLILLQPNLVSMAHHCMPECLVEKKLNCCVQGQGHNKGLKMK